MTLVSHILTFYFVLLRKVCTVNIPVQLSVIFLTFHASVVRGPIKNESTHRVIYVERLWWTCKYFLSISKYWQHRILPNIWWLLYPLFNTSLPLTHLSCSYLDYLLFQSNICHLLQSPDTTTLLGVFKENSGLLRCIHLIKVVGECNPLIGECNILLHA